jgi:hypothetical protein
MPTLPSPVPDLIDARHGQPGRFGELLAECYAARPAAQAWTSASLPTICVLIVMEGA